MKDIVVGVDESAILRRLIRNRQKKGIEKRLERELDAAAPAPPSKRAVTSRRAIAPELR